MTTLYLAFFILPALAVLQATVIGAVQWLGSGPEIVYVVVICWAMVVNPVEGMAWGLLGGAALDLLSGMPVGTTSLAYVIAAFGAGLLQDLIFQSVVILPMLVGAVGTALSHVVILIVLTFGLGYDIPVEESLATITLPAVFYNTVLIFFLFPVIRRVHRRLYADQRR